MSAVDGPGSALAAGAVWELARLRGRAAAERETVEVDPITLRVIGGGLNAIAKEMAQILYRMAYSSIIRESEDLGAGLFDAQGRELCESDSTPMHIGSIPAYIRGVNRRLATRSGHLPAPATSSCTTTPTTGPRTRPTTAC